MLLGHSWLERLGKGPRCNETKPASAFGWRYLSRIAHKVDDLVRGIARSPGVIDNILDRADTAQGDSDKIVELDPR
jgi:hypothetical protein